MLSKVHVQNYLSILEAYRVLILSKEPKRKRFVWEMFLDYQLALIYSMKIRLLKLTNDINKLFKLVALISQWKQRRWNAKDGLYKISLEL